MRIHTDIVERKTVGTKQNRELDRESGPDWAAEGLLRLALALPRGRRLLRLAAPVLAKLLPGETGHQLLASKNTCACVTQPGSSIQAVQSATRGAAWDAWEHATAKRWLSNVLLAQGTACCWLLRLLRGAAAEIVNDAGVGWVWTEERLKGLHKVGFFGRMWRCFCSHHVLFLSH